MSTPDWLQDALFYQIFPDRFANGDPSNNPSNVQPWGAPPTLYGFQGGDLRGIQMRLDYLLDLGINAIYLNPIFLSPSNHRYNTTDYFAIDPKLGSLKDFQALVGAAHAKGMRIILDGVFNHCARGFFAFADLLENGSDSPYLDWFHVRRFPLNAYAPGKARNFAGWWGYKSLPKFNTDNPAVRRYLIRVARYWIEQGADGWRLDVPNEIDDDDFWSEFRWVVKSANPQAGLIGEIWEANPRWLGEKTFDGLMNYPLRAAILGLLMKPGTPHSGVQIAPLTSTEFANRLEALLKLYPRENVYSMYNLLGSHDTDRLVTLLEGDLEKIKLAYAILYAYPGSISMYYGDEIGLAGGRDPDCRGAFPWEKEQWNTGLQDWVKKLIHLRQRLAALRRGDFRRLLLDEQQGSYAFARTTGQASLVVALNASPAAHNLAIPWNRTGLSTDMLAANPPKDLLNAAPVWAENETLQVHLPAWGIAWIGQ